MDRLIPVVNKLQEVFAEVNMQGKISLPQIAVVGAQSSGKSSVLENIVGRDFLPRGSGIVTRRPLVLNLNNIKRRPDVPPEGEAWAEFSHIPGKKFYDFVEVRREIERATETEAGKGQGISKVPINLRVYSPDVVNLTLVDLPGVTKIPVGNQPANVDQLIREMVKHFIGDKNCIILAVTAANQDIANSDALQLALEVDPEGDRTLGVLTKLDLMDQGTDAMDILTGKVYPLKRGFIGVVNRSQRDIDTSKDIRSALRSEELYFANHPAYGAIKERMGTQYLAGTLNKILLNHIRATLPSLKERIYKLTLEAKQKLAELGQDGAQLSSGGLLLNYLTKYTNSIVGAVDGTEFELAGDRWGGAEVLHIFQGFSKRVMDFKATDGLSDNEVRRSIENAKGPRSSLFIPEQSFEFLVRQQVKKLEPLCLDVCAQVEQALHRVCARSEREVQRFPKLREAVHVRMSELLQQYMVPLREFVSNLIKTELAYVNTNHPHFFNSGEQVYDIIAGRVQPGAVREAAPPATAGAAPGAPAVAGGAQPAAPAVLVAKPAARPDPRNAVAEREKRDIEIIKLLLTEYFEIVKINTADRIPKVIILFLVNKLKEDLQNELVATFYKEQLFDDLLQESEDIARYRKVYNSMLKALNRASDALSELGDYQL